MAVFISFEGIEGTGKTTQIARVAEELAARGVRFVKTREPGGCPIADQIRAIVLDARNKEMDKRTELLLYLAARAQHVAEVVRPALMRGEVVLCDRFTDATEAYQGAGRGHDPEFIHFVTDKTTEGLRPDLTILLDLPVEVGLRRARGRAAQIADVGDKEDRFERESLNFHQKVRDGYLAIAEREPTRVRVVDADGEPDEVFSRLMPLIDDIIDREVTAPGGEVAMESTE
ncbi:MAG: dTMP kinase [Deltaproteobacteria bacterium]|nr:dTMP kinase [Deltaproteobacteria bacterium]